MTRVTESSSDPFSTLPPKGPIPEAGPKPTATTTLPSDVQVFEGVDFINSSDIIIQQFAAGQQQQADRNAYTASTQNPVLPPPDPEGQTGPQPFEPSWRRAVNKDFKEQLRLVLMKKVKEEDKTGQTPAQVESRINAIIQSITAGKTETLSAEDKKGIQEATQQVQTRWKLPSSWTPGTREAKAWTPIAKEVTPPVNIEISRREFLVSSLDDLTKSIDNAAKKVGDYFPKNSPTGIAIATLEKVIMQAIAGLKAILQDMQSKDYDISTKVSASKFQAVEDRQRDLANTTTKMKEALDKRREQEGVAKIMKILAPVISAVVILIGVLALPFTAGLSAGLIIAGIAVAAVMLTYTIVDATLDVTSKAMQAFNSWLESSFPGDQAWKATLIKAILVTVLIVILIVAIVATGGGAAANVATATTAQIVKQAVLETIRQLTIQFSVIAIMSSNILPELAVKALVNTGAVDKNDEKAQMIIRILITVLTMLCVMIAVAKGGKVQGVEGAGAAAKPDAKSVASTAKLSDQLKQGIEEATKKLKELIQDGVKFLKSSPENLKDAGKEFLSNLSPKNMKEGLKSFGQGDFYDLPSKIQDGLRMAGLSVEVGLGCYMATLSFKLAKVYEEMGELQKAEELTKMLIKLLDQLLASFQEGMTARSEWMSNLDGAINSVFSSAQQTINKATQYAV